MKKNTLSKVVKIRERKKRRGLSFRMSLEFMNLVFSYLKLKKYRLLPKDAEIVGIRHEDMMYDGYTVVVKSKEFPLVAEGCHCNRGWITIDKVKGIIKLVEEVRNEENIYKR